MPKVHPEVIKNIQLPAALSRISGDITRRGGKIYLVGGWVRDRLLGIPSKDYDLEIYNLEQDPLLALLRKYGKPNLVGKAFGVINMSITGKVFDFAFPRTESKTGKGHRGFLVKPDPHLTFAKAAARRDFTINAMGIRLPDMELEDPHGGMKDLKNGLLIFKFNFCFCRMYIHINVSGIGSKIKEIAWI